MSNPTNNAPGLGVRSVHQSKPIGAVPPKPTPAQLKAQTTKKAPPKSAAKRGK